MRTAAFFDLDKTILAKSSSLAFTRPFYEHGLIRRSALIRGAYAQLQFRRSGADHEQMEALRTYLSQMVAGWDVEVVRTIVNESLDDIVTPMVFEEALALIAEHRAADHDVHVISSSGSDIIAPIGERLGVDSTVGTELEVVDGRYTGTITFYAYGPGKAEAMARLADEHGYDLALCHAYSDSITDLPMLEAVGYPVAVNPDSALRQIAEQRGWPILDFERPVAMRPRLPHIEKRTAITAAAAFGAGLALTAIAVGIWYAAHHRRTSTSAA
jgi:HAD superfamily hydrolase (TIGR01490 family)